MLLFGIILMGIAVWLVFGFTGNKKKLEAIRSVETHTVDFLESLRTSMSEGVGKGSLSYLTEVKGKIVCPEPLRSELANVECVYFSMSVKRNYEEVYYDTDDKGQRHRRTRSSSETLASNERFAEFFVQDATGKIKVNPGGAEFVAEKVLSKFEPANAGSSGRLSVGSFSIQIPMMREGDRRTTGYGFEEYAIPVGRSIYVNGQATDRDGDLCIAAPAEKGRFIVSTKSEEELLKDVSSAMMWMKIGAVLCGIGGIVMTIMGFMQK